ncbi:MAG: hypothetical protein ACQERJ_04730 [Bacillota bacterium]
MYNKSAYIIVELLIAILLMGIVVSLLLVLSNAAVDLGEDNHNKSLLQRETLLSLEMINNIIDNSSAVKQIKEKELLVLTTTGEWKKLYYKSGLGLCYAADNNIISQYVADLKFTSKSSSLLIVELVVKQNNSLKKLKTGIEL